MTDLHIHTTLSHDGRENIENYLKKAVEFGEKRIGFSEHLDANYGQTTTTLNRDIVEKVNQIVLSLREKYQDRIEILYGVEFGYTDNFVDELINVANTYPYDYIINSVHRIKKYGGFYHGTVYANLDKKQAYTAYLESILESVNAPYDYQILGHLGYAARYAPFEDKLITLKEYSSLYTEIFKTIIKRGVALELNTAVKTLPTYFLPHREVLEKYLSLGGKLLTFGSDAHDLLRFHENEDKVKETLLSYGIKETYYYKNRKAIAETL